MKRPDLTNADMAAVLWSDLFGGMTVSLNTSVPQGAQEDSITGYHFIADADLLNLPNYNTGNDTAFTPTPTTSMGSFTTQWNYSFTVSKQRFDSRH